MPSAVNGTEGIVTEGVLVSPDSANVPVKFLALEKTSDGTLVKPEQPKKVSVKLVPLLVSINGKLVKAEHSFQALEKSRHSDVTN
tara:strand:+ start:678 stop:932 length:255 start_codon:yes stop_codon:yes gene_type:complete